PASLRGAYAQLGVILDKIAAWLPQLSPEPKAFATWAELLHRDCAAQREEMLLLAPWLQADVVEIPPHASSNAVIRPIAESLERLNHTPALADIAALEQGLCLQIEEAL